MRSSFCWPAKGVGVKHRVFNPLALSDKLILVTGASSGIGRAAARVLGRLGARVILSGRDEKRLQEAADEIGAAAWCAIEPFDLSDVDAIPAWVRDVVSKHGGNLYGLVHCAGVNKLGVIRSLKRESIEEVMIPNLYSSMLLVRACSARDVADPAGSAMVFISSIAALTGQPGMSVYGASKAALISFVQAAAQELAARRIRLNCIAPAYVDTPMLNVQRRFTPPEAFEANLKRQALGLIDPEEVGVAAAFLLSPAAAHITGSTLVIGGGYS